MKLFGAFCCFLLVGLVACAEGERKYYHGDKVLRLYPAKDEHHQWLNDLRMNADPNVFDFWSEPNGINNYPVDVHVSKDVLNKFTNELNAANVNFTVNVHDLQKLIDEVNTDNLHRQRRQANWWPSARRRPSSSTRSRQGTRAANILNTFATYDDIVTWLNSMCSQYSSLSSCGSIGTTYEKRDLRYIKLGSAGSKKREIIIEAGIHSREWLAPATIISIINRLLTTYNTDSTAKRMLDTYDFYIVPSANPDGYTYSQTNDRMWRKTRSKSSSSICAGVDPNRNYDIYWASSGSSNSPCSDIYHGPKAFSEPETLAMSNFVKARKSGGNVLAFFAVHTYSQMWLIPYADKKGNYPSDFSEMKRVGNIGMNALMAVNNKKWQCGNTVDVLSAAAGGSDDWAKSIGIVYSYTLELRPADTAANGFVVAASEIDPSAKEVYAGLVAALDAMIQ